MVILPAKNSPRGLTLIEVLIALAIVSIAMTAVIKAASQSIRATSYLQDKMIATWVATNMVNEARVGVIKLPGANEQITETTMMLSQKWYSQLDESDTPNKNIKKIDVAVYKTEPDADTSPLIRLESYVLQTN